MKYMLSMLAVALTAMAITLGFAVPAQAAIYMSHHLKYSDVCIEDHGWRFVDSKYAARLWDMSSEVRIYSWNSCASRPDSRKAIIKTYQGSNDACAHTDIWRNDTTNAMVKAVIWLNTAKNVYPFCWATYGMRLHVIAHEQGHVLGLDHGNAGDKSVMQSWDYNKPTSLDFLRLNSYYKKW